LDRLSIAQKSVDKLKLGFKEVLSIDTRQKALDAFNLIYDKSVSGVAVVDEGQLVGNISASDIKNIGAGAELLSRVFLPADEFLKLAPKVTQAVSGPYCVRPDAKFEAVVTQIVLTKSHRIYVINEFEKLIGVISLGDVLQMVVQHL